MDEDNRGINEALPAETATEPPTATANRKGVDAWKEFKVGWGYLLASISVLVLVVGVPNAFWWYVDSTVDKRLNDPAVIERLAQSIRPSFVFDSQGNVLVDMGGVAHLVSEAETPLTVTRDKPQENAYTIDIRFRKHLDIEPQITPLDGMYVVKSERIGTTGWRYELFPIQLLVTGASAMSDAPPRFRLELIRPPAIE